MSCLFCRIVAREVPAAVVHEDDDLLAFRDITPRAPLHVLVVPKKHVEKVADAAVADEALLGKLLRAGAAVAKAEGHSDFRLAMNNGEGAGQSVFHVHLHVLAGRAFSWPPG